MGSTNPLAEIARSLLLEDQSQTPMKMREKAGILALLNLLGIVDAFYGAESPAGEVSPSLSKNTAPSAGEEEPGTRQVPSTIANIVSALSGMTPGLEPPQSAFKEDTVASVLSAVTRLVGQREGGLDPNVVAALLKVMSSMSRAKSSRPGRNTSAQKQGQKEEPGAMTECPSSRDAPSPAETGEPSGEPAKDPESKSVSEASESKSELQASLGIDPKLLTVLFNFLAGLDLSKQKTPPKQELVSKPRTDAEPKQDTSITVSPDGKTIITESRAARPKPEPRSYHKPGLGIRKGWVKETALFSRP
ncbi:MAG TPA: hypothetical protein GXX30_08425 [Firmicutes bacterium]|nr:hypothetical protein [Candidatus Fermentithermobacillaceae bacterium]